MLRHASTVFPVLSGVVEKETNRGDEGTMGKKGWTNFQHFPDSFCPTSQGFTNLHSSSTVAAVYAWQAHLTVLFQAQFCPCWGGIKHVHTK